ncbi:MAG: hypothetical protein CSB47_04120 [Proteobacteria bacterium]|nr:MAG: hypothetical protein CSB47_04120 [Pseudomonadota bacterium]
MNQQFNRFSTPVSFISGATLAAYSSSTLAAEAGLTQDSVISILVAAISGGALVTALWALLLGRKSMKKDREFVTKLKQNIVKDQRRIDKSMKGIEENESRANRIIERLVHQSNSLVGKQHSAWLSSERIQEAATSAEQTEARLREKTEAIERRIEQAQKVWDERLGQTENTVLRIEQELRDGLNHLEVGIKRVQQQDAHSYQLAQHITAQHSLQLSNLEANNELADQVRLRLNQTLDESTQLLDHLRSSQSKADEAYQKYMESIGRYENDLYTQYDSAFQGADMARQELSAHVNESRIHLENLRRYEEQSRYIKETTESNLQQLDVKSINELSTTLETTQQTFQSLSKKVAEAQHALNSLNQIDMNKINEAELGSSREARHYQEAVGHNNLVSFFTSRKDKER